MHQKTIFFFSVEGIFLKGMLWYLFTCLTLLHRTGVALRSRISHATFTQRKSTLSHLSVEEISSLDTLWPHTMFLCDRTVRVSGLSVSPYFTPLNNHLHGAEPNLIYAFVNIPIGLCGKPLCILWIFFAKKGRKEGWDKYCFVCSFF